MEKIRVFVNESTDSPKEIRFVLENFPQQIENLILFIYLFTVIFINFILICTAHTPYLNHSVVRNYLQLC